MKIVISKLGADTAYSTFGDSPRRVLVRGTVLGRNTPEDVRTEVSDEDAAFLASHGLFKEHAARGFVRIESAPAP